ncbi:MAG: hypothetical protein K0R54_2833 [Clostridiaceae bacterium]|jgi:hypothetical protein|nr:hypothetical protein [Clostridiaceae bacterium]
MHKIINIDIIILDKQDKLLERKNNFEESNHEHNMVNNSGCHAAIFYINNSNECSKSYTIYNEIEIIRNLK